VRAESPAESVVFQNSIAVLYRVAEERISAEKVFKCLPYEVAAPHRQTRLPASWTNTNPKLTVEEAEGEEKGVCDDEQRVAFLGLSSRGIQRPHR
jgi:hypothetical protein